MRLRTVSTLALALAACVVSIPVQGETRSRASNAMRAPSGSKHIPGRENRALSKPTITDAAPGRSLAAARYAPGSLEPITIDASALRSVRADRSRTMGAALAPGSMTSATQPPNLGTASFVEPYSPWITDRDHLGYFERPYVASPYPAGTLDSGTRYVPSYPPPGVYGDVTVMRTGYAPVSWGEGTAPYVSTVSPYFPTATYVVGSRSSQSLVPCPPADMSRRSSEGEEQVIEK